MARLWAEHSSTWTIVKTYPADADADYADADADADADSDYGRLPIHDLLLRGSSALEETK